MAMGMKRSRKRGNEAARASIRRRKTTTQRAREVWKIRSSRSAAITSPAQ
jgi:hypothetical protein